MSQVIKGKTNYGLIDYCRHQLGRPYWFGTSGQISSQDLLNTKSKQFPKHYMKSPDYKVLKDDYKKQLGVKVHDCMGLVEGYLWSDDPDKAAKFASNNFPDWSANGFYNHCTRRGSDMSKMPDVPGIAVFMDGHIGIYVGNGEVIEARGHAYGVVTTKLNERKWVRWAYIDEIEYQTPQQAVADIAEKKNGKPQKQFCCGLR